MLTKVSSVASVGIKPIEIETEINVSDKGFPGFSIVGLASKAVDEARERVKTAIINSDFEFPEAKITVNMAPADIPKEGSAYDLPIAMGIIACQGKVVLPKEKAYFYGELSLDGSLNHTKGVFLLALLAKEQGVKSIYVPRISANEASMVTGVKVFPVENLKALVRHFQKEREIEPLKTVLSLEANSEEAEFDFSEIRGQEQAKRALVIAAAGGHNLILLGSPGSGKTMLARALVGVLPQLTEAESLEVTKIYSITGNIPPGGSLIRTRPFRSPHHTTSQIGLIGGGSNPHPGEVSLAHRGVLFLDEFPEFGRSCIEALRQPLEDGQVSISRSRGSIAFPARFMLVAAANPCPCGYLGDEKKTCKCNPFQIEKYQRKLSGPILDRIDMHVNVPSVNIEKLTEVNPKNEETSRELRIKISRARVIQNERFRSSEGVYCNADMKNRHLKKLLNMEVVAENMLKRAASVYGLSARTYFRIQKVSRTIADLEGSKEVLAKHVSEALIYRLRGDNR